MRISRLLSRPALDATRNRALAVTLVAVGCLLTLAVGAAPALAQSPPKVLVFHGTTGTPDPSVDEGVAAIRALGEANDFSVDDSDEASVFTASNLEQYRAVVFLHTSGAVLDAAQEGAFRNFVEEGGGYFGIGAAARAQPDSSFFTDLIGARPADDSPTSATEAVVAVGDRVHLATKDLPLEWTRTDVWFKWRSNPTGKVHTLARVHDVGAPAGDGSTEGTDRPITWCRDVQGGGRSFYTAMGRTAASYGDDNFRELLLGAIEWTSGLNRSGCKATIASNYKKEKLTQANATSNPEPFDQIGEPHGLVAAPDGRIIYVGRGGNASPSGSNWDDPNIGLGFGTIHVWDPSKPGTNPQKVTKAAVLPVFGNRGGGEELVKTEEGLLGIALSPDFAQTGHIFVYWMPHSTINRTTRIGNRRISRFTLNHATNTIDLATERVILEWPTQIHSCCHAGGGMGFDSDGNLYITTGDNNSSQGSGAGYSGNNPKTKFEVAGEGAYSYQDARATAGNTNNLNGKLIRIKPLADPGTTPGVGSTYTIPAGPNGPNLFPTGEGGKARPEIFAMGLRNPSRLWVDPTTNWVYTAWVGPDANAYDPQRGPAQYESAAVITEAGNYGWPYCMGDKQPYRDQVLSGENVVLGGWYNCDAPKNESPNNVDHLGRLGGLTDLPAVKPVNIWYGPNAGSAGNITIQGGCPTFRRGADNIPDYSPAGYAGSLCPWVHGGGGQAMMAGPLYRYPDTADPSVAFPRYWTGKWFLYDVANANNIRHALLLDPDTAGSGGQPTYVDSLREILSGITPNTYGLMDGKFGPDGAFYLLNYGGGFFNYTANSALWRVTYTGGADTPGANPSFKFGPAALQVRFSSKGSGGVSYAWEFGDGQTSTEANPSHTYAGTGPFTARLTVTYADGSTDTKTIEVQPLAQPDTQAPTTTLTLAPDPGEGWSDDPVEATLTATDAGASGVDRIEYKLDDGPFQRYFGPFKISEPGEHTLEYRAVDKSDNVETAKQRTVRVAAKCEMPQSDEFNGTSLDSKWEVLRPNNGARSMTGTSLRLLVRSGDMIGGTASAQNVLLQGTPGGQWTATTKLNISELGAEGQQAGLIVWKSESPNPSNDFVKIVFINKGGGTRWFEYVPTQNGNALRFPNTGALSGIPNDVYVRARFDGQRILAQYSFNGEDFHPIGDPITELGQGPFKVGMKISDNADANNGANFDWFRLTTPIIPGEDNVPPLTTARINPTEPAGENGWYTSPPTVTLDAQDPCEGAGVEKTEYQIDGGGWRTYDGPFEVSDDGSHRIEYRSTDERGNVEAIKSLTPKVDSNTPTTTAKLDPAEPGAGGTYPSGPVKVSLSPDDGGGSGVTATEYRVDGGEWKPAPTEERIFDGTRASLARWTQAPGGGFRLLDGGVIEGFGDLGMLWYPVREYGDFSLKFQWKDARTDDGFANSGAFVRFPDPRTPLENRPWACGTRGSAASSQAWVAIYCGHEIQIYDGPTGETQKTGSIYNFQPRNLEQARVTPKGTWNDYEIRVVGQHYTIVRNGAVINEFDNTPGKASSRAGDPPTELRQFSSGYIGLQNHGDADKIHIRDVRVQDLSAPEIEVTSAGQHTVEYRSHDVAGNAEEPKSVTFRIGSEGGPGPGPGANPPPRPGPGPAKLSINRLKKTTLASFLRRGLRVTAQCTAGMRGTARIEVSRSQARKLRLSGLQIASRSVTCRSNGTASVLLKASKKAKRALRKARGSITVTVRFRMSNTRTTVAHSRMLVLRGSRK